MVSHTLKTIYCCLHDAPEFGGTPIIKMEIHKQGYFSHKEFIDLRNRLENFIEKEIQNLNHKPDYNGAWPQ